MPKKKFRILAINPGATSTKLGLFENEDLTFSETIPHSAFELEDFPRVWDQYRFRERLIRELLAERQVGMQSLDAVVARGGLVRPLAGGTYSVNNKMIEDARIGFQGEHASNLGCVLAYGIGWRVGIPAFIVDPPSVDEFEPLARYSGLPEIPRRSLVHALNIHAMARQAAADLGKKYEETNFVVAHLGGGISICPVKGGRIIDTNNAVSGGPFSPERSGSLPVMDLIDLCFSGKYPIDELKHKVMGEGGLVAYLGTNSASEVETRIKAGDTQARLVYEAMAYQIAKEIGSMSTVLAGKLAAIVLTGGLAKSKMLTDWIKARVGWIAPVVVYPGEDELQALVLGALRVLRNEETVKEYK
jgi:butyrate kinase